MFELCGISIPITFHIECGLYEKQCCPFLGGGYVVVDLLFIATPIVCEVLCLFWFCCSVLSSFAVILMGKRDLVALL